MVRDRAADTHATPLPPSVAPARSWRLRVAVGEGVRAALRGRWLSTVVLTLAIWMVALPGAVDAVVVARLVAAEEEFLAAGGATLVVENEQAGISALACDRLTVYQGVSASAALDRLAEPATPSAARGADVTVFATTAGMWRLLGVEASPGRSAIVPESVAARLGLVDGDWLVLEPSPGTGGDGLPDVPLRITVADGALLGDEFTGVLLPQIATPDVVADACVVSGASAGMPGLKEALPALLPGVDGSGYSVVRDRLITGQFTVDYSASYRQRPTQWAWLAAGAALGTVWLLARWTRRSEEALYAAMGAGLGIRSVLRGTEWLVVSGVGGLWGTALGVVIAVAAGATWPTTLAYVTRHAGATLLLATALVLVGQLRRPRSLLADLKDR